jgi:hypothetical protein
VASCSWSAPGRAFQSLRDSSTQPVLVYRYRGAGFSSRSVAQRLPSSLGSLPSSALRARWLHCSIHTPSLIATWLFALLTNSRPSILFDRRSLFYFTSLYHSTSFFHLPRAASSAATTPQANNKKLATISETLLRLHRPGPGSQGLTSATFGITSTTPK